MPILTAEYNNPAETTIFVTYDDGRPDAYVPDDLVNRDRQEVAEWEAEPNTITPFVDVSGRVDQAKVIGISKLDVAAQTARDTATFSMGGFTFTAAPALIAFISFNLASTTPSSLTVTDSSGTDRVVTETNQRDALDSLRTTVQMFVTELSADKSAVNAAGSVAAVDTALAASSFGDLSPAFEV